VFGYVVDNAPLLADLQVLDKDHRRHVRRDDSRD
jgi:hypothetical protein